jgi:hypothetical protein
MVPNSRIGLALFASTGLLASSAAAEHVSGGKWTFSVDLTAEAEAAAGDTTMSGEFMMTVNPGDKEVCYVFVVNSTAAIPAEDTPTAAHIHIAPPEVAGDVVIPLVTPILGVNAEQCSPATSRQIAQILAKPGDFYVNVHTAAFPAGAIRGQFERPGH